MLVISVCCIKLAGADGNRTHRGRDAPPIGFEDRERHQATNCSHKIRPEIYQLDDYDSSFLSLRLDDVVGLLHCFNGFEHVRNLAYLQFVGELKKFQT